MKFKQAEHSTKEYFSMKKDVCDTVIGQRWSCSRQRDMPRVTSLSDYWIVDYPVARFVWFCL
ncbi:unnamed protein product [Arabidopsis lyrata]|uniref:Expressed protein n=1 Tax=Arabidopsis lyrata subsp. lyrata TaxID=81972 RepID=D7MT87_ARALL|nr:predicted protein [Arabidopsis lyrata subsp. lyrata]EFH42913.1 expressed protein [Arabidopsis lyrata subsp. lyrata]CAH8280870.1 unnamed protein product [Arabidopsis lyrata]